MAKGHVKIGLELLDRSLIRNHRMLALFLWCLQAADDQGKLILDPLMASRELGLNEWDLRACLSGCQDLKLLKVTSNGEQETVSILNWERFERTVQREQLPLFPEEEAKRQQEAELESRSYRGEIRRKAYTAKLHRKNRQKYQYHEDFEVFWGAYPRGMRRDKIVAYHEWRKFNGNRPDADTLLKAIDRWKASGDWTREGGKFIPLPENFLKRKYWMLQPKDDEEYFS